MRIWAAFGIVATWSALTLGVAAHATPCPQPLAARSYRPVTSAQAAADASALVAERRPLSGLASFYNSVTHFQYRDGGWDELDEGQRNATCLVAAVGRYRTLIASSATASAAISRIEDGRAQLDLPPDWTLGLIDNSALTGGDLRPLRYPFLWAPLAALAIGVEHLLAWLQASLTAPWGLAIILLAVAIRTILVPFARWTAKAQRTAAAHEARLAPRIAAIRREHRGERAHELTMAAYRELGISPFFRVRPLAGALVQIPVLIAVFNVLGTYGPLADAPFLWIADLSMPDSVGALPFHLPMLGDRISLLPLLMTAVAVAATMTYRDDVADPAGIRRQRRNGLFTALLFLLLFYPFPAAMVLYWLTANVLQLGQQIAGQRFQATMHV